MLHAVERFGKAVGGQFGRLDVRESDPFFVHFLT
jgi:hypothetical protein